MMVRDLLEAMRANPSADWRIAEVETLCRQYGLRCSPPTGGGSHHKVSHPLSRDILTIPSRRPIKPIYIRKLVRLVESTKADKG